MAQHNDLGNKGEQIATRYLVTKGYNIVSLNWRANRKEIDIIAIHEGVIVFIEVKTRSSSYFDSPENSVTKSKQRLLISAANLYLKKNNIEMDARFDIISIVCNSREPVINHIESAFYPTL